MYGLFVIHCFLLIITLTIFFFLNILLFEYISHSDKELKDFRDRTPISQELSLGLKKIFFYWVVVKIINAYNTLR